MVYIIIVYEKVITKKMDNLVKFGVCVCWGKGKLCASVLFGSNFIKNVSKNKLL